MKFTRTHKVLIGVAALGVLACGTIVIVVAAMPADEYLRERPRIPTLVGARIDPALDSSGAVRLSHHWTYGTANVQFDRRDVDRSMIFDIDRNIGEETYPRHGESLEIWISPASDGFRARALAWWWASNASGDIIGAQAIRGIVRMDAARMPEGDEERVVEYSLDATRWGDPVHFGGKFAFRASDLTPAPSAGK